ncbi:hypothetical protein E6O75_ATG08107 [Venturia nashicola]|uniref:Uncharacterized protein n=1 Tax=Venturia nashicola TaxID=86259 RepID=A0A4Z1P7Z5_9PEZI|nr:hypothetical protein E6O75_ATG08107 [Venturia nashicola]
MATTRQTERKPFAFAPRPDNASTRLNLALERALEGVGTYGPLLANERMSAQILVPASTIINLSAQPNDVSSNTGPSWALDPDQFEIRDTNWQMCLDTITARVLHGLEVEDYEKKIVATLRQMHVLGPGKHDLGNDCTGNEVFGTLLICLDPESLNQNLLSKCPANDQIYAACLATQTAGPSSTDSRAKRSKAQQKWMVDRVCDLEGNSMARWIKVQESQVVQKSDLSKFTNQLPIVKKVIKSKSGLSTFTESYRDKTRPDDMNLSSSLASTCKRLLEDANEQGLAVLGKKLLFAAILLDSLVLVKSIIRLMNIWDVDEEFCELVGEACHKYGWTELREPFATTLAALVALPAQFTYTCFFLKTIYTHVIGKDSAALLDDASGVEDEHQNGEHDDDDDDDDDEEEEEYGSICEAGESDDNEKIIGVEKEGGVSGYGQATTEISAGDKETEMQSEGDSESDAAGVVSELAEPPFGLFDTEGLQDFLDQELCNILEMRTILSSDIESLMWILKLRWIPRLRQNQEQNLNRCRELFDMELKPGNSAIGLNISNCKLVVDFLNVVSESRHPYIINVKSKIFEALMPLLAVAIHLLPTTKRPHCTLATTDSTETQTRRDDSSDVDDTNTIDESEVLDAALDIKDPTEALRTANELGLQQDITCLLENLTVHMEKRMPKDLYEFLDGFLVDLLYVLAGDAAAVDASYQGFSHAIFHLFWHRYVGNRPQEPNWSRQPVSCSLDCSDCWTLNAFLGHSKRRDYIFGAGERRRDHIQSRIEGKHDSLNRYLCLTRVVGYRKERLQIRKIDPSWTEAKQAQRQRNRNFFTLLDRLKPSTLEDLIGGTMAIKLSKATANRSVVDIIQTARDIRAAEAIVSGQVMLHEEQEDADEVAQQMASNARMMPLAPVSGNKRKSDIADLSVLTGEPVAKRRNEIVDLCEED